MDADKPVTVLNLPPVRFIGGPSNQLIKGNIQGAWELYISVAVVTAVVVTGGGGVVENWNGLQESSDLFRILL